MTSDVTTGISPADQIAIATLPQRVAAAWATQDAETFGSVFIEDGIMILPGVYRKGAQQIADYMRSAFQGSYLNTQVVGTPIGMKPLTPDVCAVFSQGGILLAGESEVKPERAVVATWFTVREGDTWKLAVYQNSPRY